jgi:hypothetical protein
MRGDREADRDEEHDAEPPQAATATPMIRAANHIGLRFLSLTPNINRFVTPPMATSRARDK